MVPDKRDSLLLFLLCGYVNDHAAFFFFLEMFDSVLEKEISSNKTLNDQSLSIDVSSSSNVTISVMLFYKIMCFWSGWN